MFLKGTLVRVGCGPEDGVPWQLWRLQSTLSEEALELLLCSSQLRYQPVSPFP
jgi:hypothetical protein